MKLKKNLVIKEVKGKIKINELHKIYNLIKEENFKSILSHLNENLIKKYLRIVANYNESYIYVLKKKNIIIGYAIYFINDADIIQKFYSFKFEIFKHLFFNLKILVILNIFLAVTRLDLIFLDTKRKNKIRKNYLNLNLLAINKKYQSRGYGNYLIAYPVKQIRRKNIKINKIICEAPSKRVLRFYIKNNFKIVGKKLRIFKNFYILQKHI